MWPRLPRSPAVVVSLNGALPPVPGICEPSRQTSQLIRRGTVRLVVLGFPTNPVIAGLSGVDRHVATELRTAVVLGLWRIVVRYVGPTRTCPVASVPAVLNVGI